MLNSNLSLSSSHLGDSKLSSKHVWLGIIETIFNNIILSQTKKKNRTSSILIMVPLRGYALPNINISKYISPLFLASSIFSLVYNGHSNAFQLNLFQLEYSLAFSHILSNLLKKVDRKRRLK